MMLKTGTRENSGQQRATSDQRPATSDQRKKQCRWPLVSSLWSPSGFSMIEVMIATVILLLGTVMIHESYLRVANLFGRYSNSLKVRLWANDQIWAAKEALLYSQTPGTDPQAGTFVSSGKSYAWSQEIRTLSDSKFYNIRLSVNWNEGNQPVNLIKETYAFRKEQT